MPILNAQHIAGTAGLYEPQRSYNWGLDIALNDAGDQVLLNLGAESFDGLELTMDEIALGYATEERYVAGKAKFSETTFVLKDYVDIGVAQALLKWHREVYNPETGAEGLARDYKKYADLVLIAPNQTISRFYKIIGLWPKRFKHGPFSHEDSAQVKIDVTLRYDRFVPASGLNQGLSGINVGILSPPI